DTVVFSSKVTAGSFSFFTDGSTRGVAGSVYPQDIDGDGIDEVIFAGIETAPNTPETYSNTRVFVFGWRNGVFQDITAQWLPGTSNEVEGVGDIGFGDFNGDGLLDAYLSATTDIQSPVDAFALMNRGGWFERVNLGENMEEHGVSIGDVNADGYDDVFASGYHAPFFFLLGGPTGLTRVTLSGYDPVSDEWHSNYNGFGSDSIFGDFLNDGTLTMVVVDGLAGGSKADTELFEIRFAGGMPVALAKRFTLPLPILASPEWEQQGITNSHDVRVENFDFNRDGLPDLLVMSRAWLDAEGNWPNISAVQFLENRGGGQFADVTAARLVGYDHASVASYRPTFDDFNHDGLTDIFLGESNFEGENNSHTVLIQQPDGTFIDTGRDAFNQLLSPNENGAIGNILRGPNGQHYFVWREHLYGDPQTTIYLVGMDVERATGTATTIPPCDVETASTLDLADFSLHVPYVPVDGTYFDVNFVETNPQDNRIEWRLASARISGTAVPLGCDTTAVFNGTQLSLTGIALEDGAQALPGTLIANLSVRLAGNQILLDLIDYAWKR
ncbi:MAG: VCBS repeat-containing protein, partial [Gammaproteobacteria bacterium]|nr:VCBS repeat-containing protein [Gammaproteobacteria bacterium]